MAPTYTTMNLKTYQKKRKFSETPEPSGKVSIVSKQKSLSFVIQKHEARRLHYDFRLEMKGVLKSWAVPKGIPTVKGDKRLAMEVEDHPLEYGGFEGVIPPGNYGAGTVMLWDRGRYEMLGGDPLVGWKKGKIHLRLSGQKLRGEWTLVRMKKAESDKTPWLLIKSGEDHPKLSLRVDNESVASHRSMKEIAADLSSRTWRSHSSNVDTPEPRKSAIHRAHFIEPMKARLSKKIPEKGDWIFEIKFDGYRGIALKNGSNVQILSRNNLDLTHRFPHIVSALETLPCETAVLDGEIVAVDDKGRSSFQILQGSQQFGFSSPIFYYVFDLIHLNGEDFSQKPLLERKEALHHLLKKFACLSHNPGKTAACRTPTKEIEEYGSIDPVRFSANLEGDPDLLLSKVRNLRLEGLIGKRPDSRYEAGRRSGSWIKIKCHNEQEFVIGGITEPKGTRKFFGSLIVGYYEDHQLQYASKVGSGFDERSLKFLSEKFRRAVRKDCPFSNLPSRRGEMGGISSSEMRRCTWIDPLWICQVRFTEWTHDHHLRHPVFMGLREDKKPLEVTRETPFTPS
jgi:bifunctional non-homologous end joining protein LigD